MLGKNLKALWVETDPDKALARARKALERGRLDAAASALKEAIEARGEETRLRLKLCRIQLSAGEAREAADGLRTFLKSRPEEVAHIRDFVEQARSQGGETHLLLEVLADHHISRKELGPAFEALERIEKKDLQALVEARLGGLKRFLEKSPQAPPRSAIPLLYFTALAQEALGEPARALESYRKVIAASSAEIGSVEERLRGIAAKHYRAVPLRCALAEIHLAAGAEEKALAEYVRVTEADPRACSVAAAAVEKIAASSAEPSSALLALARIRQREGKVEDVLRTAGALMVTGRCLDDLLAILEALVADGKTDPRIQLVLGEAALRAGKVSRAAAAFTTAASHPVAEIRSRAREALQRIVDDHPGELRALEALCDHVLREGRFDDAVALLDRLASADASAASRVAGRLHTVLLSAPGHAAAETLMEKLAPSLGDIRLSCAFLRRRLRAGGEEARRAAAEAPALLAANPRDPEALIAAAEARAACGDAAGAWAHARNLVDGTMGPDPALLHLLVLLGGSSAALCREISDVFRTMAPALAASPEGTFALGEMAARSGDMATALEAFRSAAAFSPAAAAEVVETVRSLGDDRLSGETAAALAEVLLDAGDHAGAAAVLSTASELPAAASRVIVRIEERVRSRPDDAALRVALARALAAGGRGAHARQLLDEGLRLAGEAAPAPLQLAYADVWAREGNLTEAVRSLNRVLARDKARAPEAAGRLEKILEVDVGHAAAHLALGRARLLEGRPRDGINALLTAWSIQPALGAGILKDLAYAARAFPLEPQVDLARAQILLGQGEVESACDALGAALGSAPAIVDEALARLEPLVRSHPSCARAHLHLARAWRLRGRVAEAAAAHAAAAEIDPALSGPAAAGLADLVRDHPDRPEPHLARARLLEAEGAAGPAAEALAAAAIRGAGAAEVLDPLRRLAAMEGPQQGRALLALAAAARTLGGPAEAARACLEAARAAPGQIAEARREVGLLASAFPRSAEALAARARIALAGLDLDAALEDAGRLLEEDRAGHGEAARLAEAIAEAGGDARRCAWLRSRALAAGGAFDEAARTLAAWAPRCDGDLGVRMRLLAARVERRRGDREAARRLLAEAESAAPDRGAFLAALHEETVAAARAAARRDGTPSETWRALRAALDLGDADRAEALAGRLGLAARGPGGSGAAGTAARLDEAAAEALARIELLRGRPGRAAALLAEAPPSSLKAHALKLAGRLVEAAAVLAAGEVPAGSPFPAVRDIYRRLAAEEMLGEPGCLLAETSLCFASADPPPEAAAPPPDLPLEGTQP